MLGPVGRGLAGGSGMGSRGERGRGGRDTYLCVSLYPGLGIPIPLSPCCLGRPGTAETKLCSP